MTLQKAIKGITVIEVMIGLMIFSLIFVFIFHTLTLFFNAQEAALENTRALYLAEEGQEAARYLRDENWTTIASLNKDDEYSFDIASTTIAAVPGTSVIDGKFTRSFMLHDVYRDSDNDIVASTTSGASIDAGSILVTVRVIWGQGEQIELQSLLTNLHNI